MHSSRRLQKDESENEERKEKEGGLRKKAWQNNLDFLLFRIITNQKRENIRDNRKLPFYGILRFYSSACDHLDTVTSLY